MRVRTISFYHCFLPPSQVFISQYLEQRVAQFSHCILSVCPSIDSLSQQVFILGSSPEALDILSDLLGGFMSNFTRFLKNNADRTPGGQEGCRGFRDTLDRSLHQVGMGGRAGLRQYWQKSVVDYTRQLDMWAEEYKNTYLRMTVSLTCLCVKIL